MIHWDWVLTAMLSTVACLLVILAVVSTLDSVSDFLDARRNQRAIARECAEQRARRARLKKQGGQ